MPAVTYHIFTGGGEGVSQQTGMKIISVRGLNLFSLYILYRATGTKVGAV